MDSMPVSGIENRVLRKKLPFMTGGRQWTGRSTDAKKVVVESKEPEDAKAAKTRRVWLCDTFT